MELWDHFWKDDRGHYVVWQNPNIFLYVWVVFTIAALVTSGKLSDVLAGIGSVDLIVWSLLEVFKGINYFRRLLGLLVLVYSVITFIKIF